MILKDETLVITLDGLTFRSYKHLSSSLVLDQTAIVGWYDGVGVKRDSTPRPTAWGDFAEKGRLNGRVVSLSGTAIAPNAAELYKIREQVVGLLIDGSYKEMRVDDGSGTKYLSVGIEGNPTWIKMNEKTAVFRVDLYAPNPRIYGPKEYIKIGDGVSLGGLDYPIDYPTDYNMPDSVAASTISNDGNAEAWSEYKVTGDFNKGFTISNARNRKVVYNGLVTLQAPVTINMGRGTAIQNGTDKTHLVSVRDWFSVPKKSTLRPVFTANDQGTGWCDIIHRDTWI